MTDQIIILTFTAAAVGFFHTLLGPDHYLPFVMMARAGKWSPIKTACVTAVCGLGHVLGSVLLGSIGIAIGLAVVSIESMESLRGNIAAWGLIAFGTLYFAWGIRKAIRKIPGTKTHSHQNDDLSNITPWVMFTIFILGPCEPLIPILMYPAAKSNLFGLLLVTTVFGVVTIITMLCAVFALYIGLNSSYFGRFERFSHALAGFAILFSGVSIQFLGL